MKMREDLVQDENYSVIYGDFHGEYQELFRCPRVQDDRDLRRYVDEYRCILGFEADNETSDLRTLKGYLGYYRLYFIDRWYGSWMEIEGDIDDRAVAGIVKITEWLQEHFPKGCDWEMEDYLKQFPAWGYEKRFLLKPIYMGNFYRILFSTEFGNSDYPVRIYVYDNEEESK